MVKVIKALSNYAVMLDMGGGIVMTAFSLKPGEIEVTFGGVSPEEGLEVSHPKEGHSIKTNTLFIRCKPFETPNG